MNSKTKFFQTFKFSKATDNTYIFNFCFDKTFKSTKI